MRIAIHQPNFWPWLPYFQKMAAVDLFVVLTHCQFARDYFQHRFKHQNRWYTMGVRNPKHFEEISAKVYANPEEDWAKIKRQLPQHQKLFDQMDEHVTDSLWRTNFSIILALAKKLNIKTEIVIDPTSPLTGTDRLIEICKASSANVYMAGRGGSHEYLELEKFQAAGIKVEFQTETVDPRHTFEVLND